MSDEASHDEILLVKYENIMRYIEENCCFNLFQPYLYFTMKFNSGVNILTHMNAISDWALYRQVGSALQADRSCVIPAER